VTGEPAQTPLKVCPNCSVATRTDADSCPSCGRRYGRRQPQWRRPRRWSWWYAFPIVAAAFVIGYFGLSSLVDSDSEGEGAGITVEQGAAVPERIPRSALERHLGGERPVLVQPRKGEEQATCAYYAITDAPDSVWEFCFERDKLFSSAPVRASGAGSELESAAPAPARRSARSGGG